MFSVATAWPAPASLFLRELFSVGTIAPHLTGVFWVWAS